MGEVTERLKVHDWKSCGGPKTFPRVRIPPSPPAFDISGIRSRPHEFDFTGN